MLSFPTLYFMIWIVHTRWLLEDYLRRMHDYRATFEALPLVAHIDRAILLGDDWMTYTASVWHNPELSIYCLTPQSCAAVHS